MSRINDLIQELCPDGVISEPLSKLFNIRNGYTPAKSNAAFWDGTGTVPWFRMEDIRRNGRILDHAIQTIPLNAVKNGILFPANSLLIATSATIGEHALITVPHLSNQRFMSLSLKTAYKELLNIKFLYYYFFILDEWCLKNTSFSSFASVNMSKFKRFQIPIPPMEIQEEIVRILDSFTSLEAELEAELETRQEQYCYYRNDIISKYTSSCKWMPLSDIGMLIRGHGMTKSDFTDKGIGAIHYGQLYTTFDTATDSVISYVSPAIAQSLLTVNPGNLIISNTSENIDDVGKAVAWLGGKQIVTGGHATVLRHNQNPKYLAYWFQTPDFQLQKRKYTAGTKVIELPAKALEKIMIPLPPLSVQSRIVSELDKFRILSIDMSSGLPAEIEARHEQYEYYRDRLLTFKELDHE